MNSILELKGKRFGQTNKQGGSGGAAINSKMIVTIEHIQKLKNILEDIKQFWLTEQRPFPGVLISVHYNKIAAKSNRIAGLFKGKDSNYAVVGAKFNDNKTKHIITYYLNDKDLDKSIKLLDKTNDVMREHFKNGIDKDAFRQKETYRDIDFKSLSISKSLFKQVVADCSYIENFEITKSAQLAHNSIVTLYDTGIDVLEMLKNIGIKILPNRVLDNKTVYLDGNQLDILFNKAPYLVSMATEDLSKFSPSDFSNLSEDGIMYIPSPSIEPTIGVIDTLFDDKVYFKDWVEYHDMVDDAIPKSQDDYRHGTAVTSIIVDGPRLNPWLDDGCGRFKVRHFGVAAGSKFSSFSVIRIIKNIVSENRDIKVWNISLGSNQEISDNFISAEAAVLDQIQYENDVIFIIAGTNKPSNDIFKIGSPADSVNSIVVNSVTKDGISTKYSRRGLALSFFAKPDVSYYGGSEEQYIKACEPLGVVDVAGTSFAAPWIARKMSYLIDVLGLTREIAKALLIDSARGWNGSPAPEVVALYGHGIVPKRIEEIIQSKDDEIRFFVTDISEKWNTYNYHFPIPIKNDEYPYIAKATMCYFPICNRAQGVDYTNTELNIHFGPIKDDGKLNEINDDKQNQEDEVIFSENCILEGVARQKFRKWDNVKYISEKEKKIKIPKKSYKNKNWGMEIKTSNRLDAKDGIGLKFGVVVTLKEMFGINRIDEFIRNCNFNGWLVNEVNIKERVAINQKLNEKIDFV